MQAAWNDAKTNPPTEHDADAMGCVIAWHEFQGVMIAGYWMISENRFFTHWMPTPERPDETKK